MRVPEWSSHSLQRYARSLSSWILGVRFAVRQGRWRRENRGKKDGDVIGERCRFELFRDEFSWKLNPVGLPCTQDYLTGSTLHQDMSTMTWR